MYSNFIDVNSRDLLHDIGIHKNKEQNSAMIILELEMLSQSLESFLLSEVAFSIPIAG
jgi:hypothetical protein